MRCFADKATSARFSMFGTGQPPSERHSPPGAKSEERSQLLRTLSR